MTTRKSKVAGMIFVLLACLLTGCGSKEEEREPAVLYQYGKQNVTFGEYYIYGKTIAEDYQKVYGEGIWSLEIPVDDGSKNVKEVTVADIILDINRVKVLVDQAEKMEIALTDEEVSSAAEEANRFYSGLTKKDIEETEITKELVLQVMEENLLARHVYDRMIADSDFEVSDEEARMTTFYDIVFECYETKPDGSMEEFTEEKKAAQLERANEALESLAKEENVTYHSIVDKYGLKYSNSYTMSKREIEETYGEQVAGRIVELSDGEVSTVVPSEYGYHIFKMIMENDEELTKKNKSAIVAQMEKDYFNETYTQWAKKYDPHFNIETDVDKELAGRFPFGVD